MSVPQTSETPLSACTRFSSFTISSALFFVALFVMSLFLFWNQISADPNLYPPRYTSDLRQHVEFSYAYAEGELTRHHVGLQAVIYWVSLFPGLTIEYAAAATLSFCVAVTGLIILLISKFTQDEFVPQWTHLPLAAVLMTVTAIYIPRFNQNVYLGQGSPNVWHNPTHIAMQPLAFGAFYLFSVLMQKSSWREAPRFILLCSAALCGATLIKSSFTIVFLPAIALHFTLNFFRGVRPSSSSVLALLPAVATLAYVIFHTQFTEDPSENVPIVFSFFGPLSGYTPNVPFSMFLSLAFPLFVLILRFGNVIKNNLLVLAWLTTAVALGQVCFLAEGNEWSHHLNFLWGYNIALHVLFVFSAIEWTKWLADWNRLDAAQKIKLGAVSAAFALHAVSGIFYLGKILSGGPYY